MRTRTSARTASGRVSKRPTTYESSISTSVVKTKQKTKKIQRGVKKAAPKPKNPPKKSKAPVKSKSKPKPKAAKSTLSKKRKASPKKSPKPPAKKQKKQSKATIQKQSKPKSKAKAKPKPKPKAKPKKKTVKKNVTTFLSTSIPIIPFGSFGGFGLGLPGISVPAVNNNPTPAATPAPEEPDWDKVIAAVDRVIAGVPAFASGDNSDEIGEDDSTLLLSAYDSIMHTLDVLRAEGKFGPWDATNRTHNLDLKVHSSVPRYFANIAGGTVFERLVLSVAGFRNLVAHGREIYSELKKVLFISDPEEYSDGTGLEKMISLTGNTLDLDTMVLRCTDQETLDIVNQLNRNDGKEEYYSADDFGDSEQARQMAIEAAKPFIQEFVEQWKLTPEEQEKRRIVVPEDPDDVPLATECTDRGKWCIWQYINTGVNTFHANVPNMTDVVGALLRAPFELIRSYVQSKEVGSDKVKEFFDTAISSSCFNAKWKSIETFSEQFKKEGTIVDKLQKLQKEEQTKFKDIFGADDDKCTKEKDLMWSLVKAQNLRGKSEKDEKVRLITKADVEAWVDDPAIKL
eukprot:TRINITY_DN47413_c0_g1_i1.p1 TRINITY_DN47413_c0_g1~~TRINITY_DN47413_c0_g1_i1.p1  ORF type:complete len:570 (+),score=76.17 TRINITY_DN47413_c0_g1_i1:21-1730(+)